MKLSGSKAQVFFDDFDESKVITSGSTSAGAWYFILDKGDTSSLPYHAGLPFRAPATGTQLTLATGDKLFPIDPERFCKTSCSLSTEEGTIDAGDDCDPGASIPDGIIKVSGSLAGLFRYDDHTGEFENVTDRIISKFFDIADDDSAGVYGITPRSEAPAYLLVCLNSNAKVGQTENWLFVPVIISSLGVSLGNTDIQNKDLSFTKGEGRAVVYKRPKTA